MVFHMARIVSKRSASPTVTVLDLQVPSLSSFLPGQWVDFCRPGKKLKWVGGFSLASSPNKLPLVTLAIKTSRQEPSKWVTNESKVGDDVEIQVGGGCVLVKDFARPAVFIAGGIGISPLLSMYRQHCEERGNGKGASFLYIVSNEEELVFIDELQSLARESGDRVVASLTQQDAWKNPFEDVTCLTGRDVMIPFLNEDSPEDAIFYVCGPPAMLDEAIELLGQRGIPSPRIVYEKWW